MPPCTYSRLQWPNREWTFLQLSATSCPQVPPTSSPAPWAPVAWIATGNARAAPRTTSKAFGLVFLWLNLVSAHRHEHLGPLLSLLEEGILSVKRDGNERSNSRGPHSSCFCPLSSPWIASRRELPVLLRCLLPAPVPRLFHIEGKGIALKPGSTFYPFLHFPLLF